MSEKKYLLYSYPAGNCVLHLEGETLVRHFDNVLDAIASIDRTTEGHKATITIHDHLGGVSLRAFV